MDEIKDLDEALAARAEEAEELQQSIEDKPDPCECGKEFDTEDELEAHQCEHCGDCLDDPMHGCEHCGDCENTHDTCESCRECLEDGSDHEICDECGEHLDDHDTCEFCEECTELCDGECEDDEDEEDES